MVCEMRGLSLAVLVGDKLSMECARISIRSIVINLMFDDPVETGSNIGREE